ncbi:2-hydroxyacyl-CoA dehydratase [bacterium]|nr:2-hydroxyacyl-CoA dehydratase [bacterium]
MGNPVRVQQICDEMREVCLSPYNDRLRAYKQEGGKIIGTLYSEVPEEIVYAAGMLPVRLRAVGSQGAELADARFTQINCSVVKHLYDSAAKGQFDFIDGLAAATACDHIRKLEENWADVLRPPFAHLICFPKRFGDELEVSHLAGEFRAFKDALERHFDVIISDDALRGAIETFNETRRLQMRLYELREMSPNPPITGAQAFAVNIAATCMPRESYNALLAELVDACEGVEGVTGYQARLVVYGGDIDSLPFIECLESEGGVVVTDSLGGFGRRSADMQVSTQGDLIENLARAYLQGRPSNPRLNGTRAARWEYLERVARRARADGYVTVHVPLCDYWSYERMMFDTEVEKKGLMALDLDTEYVFTNVGQTRTRVQAFVEQIAEGRR